MLYWIVYEKIQKWQWVDWGILVGMMVLTVGVGISIKKDNQQVEAEVIKKITPTQTMSTPSQIVCEIAGEVIKAGTYKVVKGTRWGEILAMAGGVSWEADREWVDKNVNRAKIVVDGEKVYIPKVTNERIATSFLPRNDVNMVLGTSSREAKININTADINKLGELPGIGPALGQRIIDYRETNDGFKNVEEIKLVSGIGDKMWEKIKDLIDI